MRMKKTRSKLNTYDASSKENFLLYPSTLSRDRKRALLRVSHSRNMCPDERTYASTIVTILG